MTALWLIVLLLLLATLAALILPMLRRERAAGPADAAATVRAFYQAQRAQLQRELREGALTAQAHARAEEELQRELLQALDARRDTAPAPARRASLAAACALSVAVPVAAMLLYQHLGDPRAAASMMLAAPQDAHAEDAAQDMTQAIGALAERLRRQPDDAEGWYMLARSYETLGRYDDAVAAYMETVRLVPDQPALLADLADALLSANGGAPDAKSERVIAQALALQPDQPKALALAGMAALRRGDAAQALAHWQRLKTLLPPDSSAAAQIDNNIAQARAMATGAPPAPQAAAPDSLAGHASIAAALRAQVADTDTVFILARPADGGRMPLAILRKQVRELPLDFTLDRAQAMSPAATLAQAGMVDVEIRVSRAGVAEARPGDLVGVLRGVAVGSRGLRLVADTVVR
ncbi:cytochrome c-type biogenesis protein CcmI [Bordetella bronchiseptica E014]|uniref:c-type cytochrome biogenesis protein CcmI n=1 Tax=Bordetella bronchiseptica TaxID=518 RepID=UPI00028B6E60|nr:c-type cytochrome biogenesis protein CcmI [Bordetella bronchiseptica]KCV31900.1 cytochrome c-type biogenesis protein CcmI [Bordetella bronchiseptica 00-P-2730]KDC13722.1 cytochrome c-type biogenesis protein CcmI [Bordetella bronchiseptica E014]KDC97855.1 cytochrome c-type biogenesis protein CcmI [Bordetella bronchiseptica MBORD675]KDE01364.1 cytochrome c-type biogenesis protein CcmI [Bordetella bronchiseptica SBL-F6116]QET72101.1 c-type cytochrome biogenesis protein CcmI [Bordetella bronchi